MGYQARAPFPSKGFVGRKGVMFFAHTVTVGAAGAISSQDSQASSGVTATKQATAGQYTYALPTAYKKIVMLNAETIGALGAVTTGCTYTWLNDDIDANNKDGTIELQWCRSDTNAAADVPNGTIVLVTIAVEVGV